MTAGVLAPLAPAKARIHARLLAEGGTGGLAERVAPVAVYAPGYWQKARRTS